ncbi:hypothetical protein [Tropicimonas marinistellae]|uniref:hypothetical protein n=1 Tax=Tropicimonas marinistellae TaxID=1739787 RepID=UPI0013734CE6|nr:hypothetical protein [Tropicimonas marinistellae]
MTLVQLLSWPLALLTGALVNLFVQDAKPMPMGRGFLTILATLAAVVCGFLVAVLLRHYPAVQVLTLCLMLGLIYRHVLTSGEHFVIVVGMLLGTTVVPVLARFHPEIANIAVGGILISILVAWLIACVAFALIPAPTEVPPTHHGEAGEIDVNATAATLALVVGSMLTIFLYFGLSNLLVLVYTALFAMSLSAAGSVYMGMDYLKGNLLYGGVGMVLVFEVLVMAPFLPLMIATVFLAIYIFATNYFSHKASAGAWSSGSFGFILLLTAMLGSDKTIASAKVIDRLSQIAIALIYVAFAFALLDFLRRLWRAPSAGPQNG